MPSRRAGQPRVGDRAGRGLLGTAGTSRARACWTPGPDRRAGGRARVGCRLHLGRVRPVAIVTVTGEALMPSRRAGQPRVGDRAGRGLLGTAGTSRARACWTPGPDRRAGGRARVGCRLHLGRVRPVAIVTVTGEALMPSRRAGNRGSEIAPAGACSGPPGPRGLGRVGRQDQTAARVDGLGRVGHPRVRPPGGPYRDRPGRASVTEAVDSPRQHTSTAHRETEPRRSRVAGSGIGE
jgi:hypothetical protein